MTHSDYNDIQVDIFTGNLIVTGFRNRVRTGFGKCWNWSKGVFQDLNSLGKSGFVIMAMEKLWKFMSFL
jgi:hypothetical protein